MTSATSKKDEEFEIVPFTVVQDSNESAPWLFRGLKGKTKNGKRLPLVIKTVKKPMWSWDRPKWGVGLADYSIDGLEYEIQIERKSLDDLFGTLAGRRDNFEREVDRLNQECKSACVIIEAGFHHIASFREHGPEPSSVIGTILAWGQRYPRVHWIPAGSRDMAERLAFRFLERFWNDREDKKRTEKTATTQAVKTETTEGSTANGSIQKRLAANSVGGIESADSGIDGHRTRLP